MAKIRVVAKRDFIESITTSSRPLPALAELIWNGLDACADRIIVSLERNDLGAIESITVRDDGTGIEHAHIEKLFGDLGDSWKKTRGKINGRALHGKNGRGRFKAFALGARVEWNTVFQSNGRLYAFRVVGDANALDDFEVSNLVEGNSRTTTGTTVTINNPPRSFRSLQGDNVPHELAKIFCAYLTEYPGVSIEYDGQKVNPADAQLDKSEYELNDVILSDGSIVSAKLSIIEWKVSTERTIHLCDANGVSLHEIPIRQKVRAPGFNFTVYVKSDYFRELDKTNLLAVTDLHEGVTKVVDAATAKVKGHFRRRLAEEQSAIVEAWKRANIYPYEEKEDLGPVEAAERQVFDILAVNVQSYLPSFEKSDIKAKKFTFSLLAQALRQNPESVQTIIGEILELKRETQDDLADLLKKTSLSSIISSSKVVANRLDFLNGLEILLFDKESKKKLLERDQLHKILEKEAWIFHEEFSLAGSEERLEEVLRKHLDKLGVREDAPDLVDVGDGGGGRIDLMLHKAAQPRAGEYDYLVVELKRPSQKINSDVLTQIEKYAIAVANDERFHDVKVRWTFMAISNELDDFAKRRARQRGKPPGMIFDDDELNITVWAKSWADVINDSRIRLSFVNQQLAYEASNDSAKEYLRTAHSKYIPEVATLTPEDEMEEEVAFEDDQA
ncbi:ATP-binding protein [Halomonas sp. M4R5S39]|uniref:ATP-binding protein n=1 Tax=Halomonas kalidii TaxID=3043293 RepID=UPI0024A8328C|nr:ATP-binding protein [Halomonas kalidii]MDI5985354.1 ATP-binding protein [Halomonas kalidii]